MATNKKPNVLFIVVDDLRTALSCYGDPVAKTPNIDRLAGRGVVFNRAYCQQAVCNPSRASVMTGRRPDELGVWDLGSHFRREEPSTAHLAHFCFGTHFREVAPEIITLPQYFRDHGYTTTSVGKIFHGSPVTQDPESWSIPGIFEVWKRQDHSYLLSQNRVDGNQGEFKMDAMEFVDVGNEEYGDGKVAAQAINRLRELGGAPFFLAVGFRKPHLPFSAPLSYLRRYGDVDVGMLPNQHRPDGLPEIALHDSRELRGYRDIPSEGPISPKKQVELRRGYYACVSYVDAQIGKLLDELDRLGLAENTVVSLYGDHGYHLGEKRMWCKTTNYELDTRAPLIVCPPGGIGGGVTVRGLAEFIDFFPTVVELCGLPQPSGLAGRSLVPLMENPEGDGKEFAISQFPRPWFYRGRPEVMGYTMRTRRHRYTEWLEFESGRGIAAELYDHAKDPAEMENLAVTAREETERLVRGFREKLRRAVCP